MNRLAALWKKDPGLVVSGGAHLLALVFLLANFSRAPTLEEPEAVAVEMVTTSELNQVMKGEETAKPLPAPQQRVDKLAAIEEHNPAPPLAEARKDTPPPPAPDKPNDDPGPDAKPPEVAAAPPPPPAPAPPVPTPPAPAPRPPEPTPPLPPVQPPEAAAPPLPPERPVEKAEAPPPPPRPEPRPDPVKPPPPPEAEAIEPTPPPRPKLEQKAEQPKPEPLKPEPPPRPEPPKPRKVARPVPVPHPREVKEAKVVPPPPPPKPEPVKPEPPKPNALDRVAQLLDTLKPDILKPSRTPAKVAEKASDKPPAKARSGNESKEPPRDTFDPSKISALLDHDAPQHKASTGRALAQVASLGAPTGHAEKMSPSMMAQLDGWMIDHYRGCWSYFGLGATQDYVPEVRVRLALDGSLIGQPALLNPPHDPNLKSLADSAVRAVNRCNPMAMPDRFKPFYQSWRDRTVRFDPKEMS